MTQLFSRREFLAGTAAATAVLLSARRPLPAAEAEAPRFRKALKFHMVEGNLSVEDKFRLVRDLGFEGLEIRSWDEADRTAVRRASEKTGLPVHGVLNSSRPEIREAIDLAKYYGASSVLLVAGRVNEDSAYDTNYAERQQLIREALPHAEKQQIKLLVENVWNNFLLSPLEMARFIDELESPWAGVYFDVGNIVRYGWPEQWIRILGKRIGKLDIKEYSRKKQFEEGVRKGFDVEIGEGDCNWPEVVKALVEIDYRGWATAEVPGGDRARLADIARRMDRVLGLSQS